MDKLDCAFCDVDDFYKVFNPEREKQQILEGSKKRQRAGRMATSEIMTIIICFHMSHYRDFKNYYLSYISRFYKHAFPNY